MFLPFLGAWLAHNYLYESIWMIYYLSQTVQITMSIYLTSTALQNVLGILHVMESFSDT